MKFRYVIDPQREVIFQAFEGDFTAPQLIACIERLWADPEYRRSFSGIVDLSAMGTGAIVLELPALMKFLKGNPRLSQGRWAAIATTPMATAASLLYRQDIAPEQTFGVFSTWEAACTFLRVDLERPALRECDVV